MTRTVWITYGFLSAGLLLTSCSTQSSEDLSFAAMRPGKNLHLEGFYPTKLVILPLTETVQDTTNNNGSFIHVYLALTDQFGSQVKMPGIFRFELYGRVLRSAEPKGKRIKIWPDVDLTNPTENNKQWHDFLRAYEFKLDFEPEKGKDYILQITHIFPNGRRLLSQCTITNP